MVGYTLRQINYFVAVAEATTLALAAEKLHVSQPSVSTAIANLESQLGVQLFIRHHAQGVSLTPSGRRLLAQAQSLLRHAQEFQHNAIETSATVSGELGVGCFVTIAAVYMPKLIIGFTQQHKDASIALTEGNIEEIIAGLATGTMELALAYDLGLPPELHFELLAEAAPYALLPAHHRLAHHASVRLSDLAEDNLILLDIPPSRSYFPNLFAALELQPSVGFSSPSFEVVRGMVGQGAGYSLLVTKPHGDFTYDGSQVVAREIADATTPARIGLAWPRALRPTQLMQAFVDYCRASIP